MRESGRELFTLETRTPVKELDILGFTLQYELSYTNILNMLELGNIPCRSEDRGEEYPRDSGRGPCAYNPEPLADFIDLFIIGDGEEIQEKICDVWKRSESKEAFLKAVCALDGVYVPKFYEPVYNEDGTVKEIRKLYEGAPDRVKRAVVKDLDSAAFPVRNIVPFIETVHDRAVVETFRGCTRGCRFCQAGMIYRPVRERKKETIERLAMEQLDNTGQRRAFAAVPFHERLFAVRGSGDGADGMCAGRNVALSLPSLRMDSFPLKFSMRYRVTGNRASPSLLKQAARGSEIS